MKLKLFSILGMALAALSLAGVAQAQTVIVRNVDEAQAAKMRAAIEASMKAAARGERVGMISGRANPRPIMLKGGGVGQELDASTMMFSVARLNSEGQVERLCVSGLETAEQAVQAPDFAKRFTLSSRESTHVIK